MTLPWNLQLGQCHILNHCNHIIGWDLMKLDALTSASALDIWSCTRSLDLELYIASAPPITWTFHLTPHLELSPPISEIKYQSFLHHYSLTNTSWVRHPIQVSSSSFHTYLRSTNEFSRTFKVSPCWHCKYEFDSKMNITEKHSLKVNTDIHFRSSSQPIRTNLRNDANIFTANHIKLPQNTGSH